jgi:polar amino acid transport system permease protein
VSGPEGLDPIDRVLLDQRRSRILGAFAGDRRSLGVGLASTVLVFLVLAVGLVNTPGWPVIQRAFFDSEIFDRSFPVMVRSFGLNVAIFLIAEVLILLMALGLAVLRLLPGPALLPLRLISVGYTDLFRGVPGILIIYMLGFGVPQLEIPGLPREAVFWGVVALVLIYSAYVAEVYRAGIESIHRSQTMAARSLGLSHLQSLRFVVIPQAVRRVIPPLLNDIIGLQKDTALVGLIGPVEAFRRSSIESAATFNFTPYLASALLFLVVTIPMARLTDRLIARDQRRLLALGGGR